jgi:hypothetical protein
MTTYTNPNYTLTSTSEEQALWLHPILDLYPDSPRFEPLPPLPIQKAKLYLVLHTLGKILKVMITQNQLRQMNFLSYMHGR